MEPRVSVLLPLRDAAATIDTALASVQRQREGRLECVVVDDGSRDDGALRVARAAGRDSRVRLLRTGRHGLVSALQEGLAACRAPFVARMDADDWMHRDRLALQLGRLEASPELAALGSHVRLFPRAALGPGMRSYEAWLNGLRSPEEVSREAFVECPLAHPTWLVRRELFERISYREAEWPEDYDLLLRWRAAGALLGVLPRRLHGWRHGPQRLSQRSPVYATDRFTACKAAFLASGFLDAHTHYGLWGYGETGRTLRRELASRGKRPGFILELHPGRIGNRIHGAPVHPPERLPELPRLPLIVSVAGLSARAEIRERLSAMGFREGSDFLCAA
ncbi:MAG: glycosyl transferase family 2 [Deltaproteobacteria bacterium]|jgi:glycosyltransferase involved in cell wall biosynthesis|nr:glycosyl transferase family 2 [Deltaproteobacteria bacterium]